jgi:hypothetical protein
MTSSTRLKNVDNKSRHEALEGMVSPPSCETIGRAAAELNATHVPASFLRQGQIQFQNAGEADSFAESLTGIEIAQ